MILYSSFRLDYANDSKYNAEIKAKVRQELKDYQEKLARDLITKCPTLKLFGGYYDSYYKYPNLKVDLMTIAIRVKFSNFLVNFIATVR